MQKFKKDHDLSVLRDKYVRRNTYLKYGLVGGVVFVVVSIFLWSYFGGDDSISAISEEVSEVTNEVTEKRRVLNPQYLSTDKKNRPFKVSAAYGDQISEEIIYLHRPRVDFVLQNGTVGILTADKGEVNQDKHTLVIQDNVVLEHQSGHKFVTAKAFVDMETRRAWGNEAVLGNGPLGTLKATGFWIEDEGETIVFKGPGRLTASIHKAQKMKKVAGP